MSFRDYLQAINDPDFEKTASAQVDPVDAILKHKEAAFNPFKNQAVIGGLVGAASGAGIGALTSNDKSQKGLLRASLVGAGMGASIGGLAGALSKGVVETAQAAKGGISKDVLQKAERASFLQGRQDAFKAIKPMLGKYEKEIERLGGNPRMF